MIAEAYRLTLNGIQNDPIVPLPGDRNGFTRWILAESSVRLRSRSRTGQARAHDRTRGSARLVRGCQRPLLSFRATGSSFPDSRVLKSSVSDFRRPPSVGGRGHGIHARLSHRRRR